MLRKASEDGTGGAETHLTRQEAMVKWEGLLQVGKRCRFQAEETEYAKIPGHTGCKPEWPAWWRSSGRGERDEKGRGHADPEKVPGLWLRCHEKLLTAFKERTDPATVGRMDWRGGEGGGREREG